MTDIKIRWTLDITNPGAGAQLLKQDRALRTSLAQTDATYRKVGATAVSVSERQAQAASRAASSTQQQGRAQVAASEEVARYAAAQREALSIGSRLVAQSAAVEGAYKRQGRAARSAASEVSRASRIRSAAGRAGSAVVGAGAAVGGAIRNAVATAGVGVGLLGFAGVGAAVKETVGFDRALRNVNSIAQLSEKNLQKVGSAIRALAGKTAQAPKTLAEGMYDLVSSGFNAKDSLTIVASAARAATAGLSTTDVSTKALAAVLNAYHYSASKANEISDTLFTTVNYGVITFGELAEHIGTLLPFSASLGVSLKEDGAAISTLTKQGIRGELAITFLKNAMVAFLKPSAGMVTAIKATGASSGEALVKSKGFEGALKAVIGTTDKSKASIAKLFPNIRSLTAALGLTGKNAKSAAKDLQGFEHDHGATNLALSQQAQSVSYQWNKLKATFSGAAISLGDKFVPAANKALGALRSLLNPKSSGGSAVKDFLGGIGAGLAGRPAPHPKPAAGAFKTKPLGSQLPVARSGPFAAGHAEPFGPTSVAVAPEASTLSKIGAAVGSVARTIGVSALTAGKQLLDAFKPALPFLQNVLLPLLIGIGKGLLSAVVGAFKILVPTIKVAATVLGFLGTVLKPLGPAFEFVGEVIGFVFSGAILKALSLIPKIGIVFRVLAVPVKLATELFGLAGKAIGKIPGALSKVGGLLSSAGGWFSKFPSKIAGFAGGVLSATGKLVTAAGKGLGRLPAKLAVNAYSAGRAVVDTLGSWIGKAGGVALRIEGAIIDPIASLAGKVAGVAGKVLGAFSDLGSKIVHAIVGAIKAAPSAIVDAVKSLIPGPVKSILGKAGSIIGSIFGGRTGGRLGQRGFRRFQGGGLVDALVSPGEQIVYGGASMMVPGRREAADSVYMQLPVGAAVLTSDGQSRMAGGASLGEALATQAPHFRAGGMVVRGRVSTFGPPGEAAGPTASGVSDSTAGVAIRPGSTWQSGKPTLGQYWQLAIAGHTGTLKQIDLGPNQSTGRRIDVTGAGAQLLGINPAQFPTDSTGTATLLGKTGTTSSSTASVASLGRSRTREGLISDALSQGVEAGASGLTRAEIARANRGARGAERNPILTAISEATAKTKTKAATTAKKVLAEGLSRPGATWNPRRLEIARWIVPYLSYGAGHGWPGVVTSGYRSRAEQERIYNSGVRPAAVPGTSNHEGTTYPSGAVDVTDASALAAALAKEKGPQLLQWAGAKDPVHFSHPVNGRYRRGGIVSFRKGGQAALQKRFGDVTGIMQRLWSVAAPYYHRSGAAMPTPTYTTGPDAAFVGVDFGVRTKHAGKRSIYIPDWVAEGEHGKGGLRGRNAAYLSLMLHEWVHEFQDVNALNRAEKKAPRSLLRRLPGMSPAAEGGAQSFTDLFGPRIIAKAGLGTFRPSAADDAIYHPAVLWVNRALGKRWVANRQFGGFRKGGVVGARRFSWGGRVRPGGHSSGPSLQLGVSRAVASGSLTSLDELLGHAAEERLEALRKQLVARARKGGEKQVVERLQGVISAIDFEIGRRIGSYKNLITRRGAGLEHGQSALERTLRRKGIEPTSVTGLQDQAALDSHAEGVRRTNLAAAKKALALAKRTGSRQQIADATEQLTAAEEELDEAVTKGVEDRRNLIRQAAQDSVEKAQFGVDSANNALSGLDIAQRLNRTAETPAALVQKAQTIQAQLLPALQSSLAALNSQLGVYQSQGDSTDAQQVLLSIQTAGNEIANAMAESAEAIRQAAEQAAAETVEAAAHAGSMAQLGEQHLELEQRIAGTYDEGGQQRAEYIEKTLIPALNNELSALQAQFVTAGDQGDPKLANQIAEAIAGKQNDLLQATLDATEEVAKNTSDRKVGGSLGFSYGAESLSDAIIAAGNGS